MNMKLYSTNSSSNLQSTDTIKKMLFPEYGHEALNVPVPDPVMNMYIVDQHVSKGGNRQVTYLAVGSCLAVELTIGFYHSFTYINKLRLMIPDGMGLKTVGTFDWPQTTYYDRDVVREKVKEMTVAYVECNAGMIGARMSAELKSVARNLAESLFKTDLDSHRQGAEDEVLKAYCRQMKVCQDYLRL